MSALLSPTTVVTWLFADEGVVGVGVSVRR